MSKTEKKKSVLWAVNYKIQNYKEGWLVATAKTAEEAIVAILEELSDSSTDYLSFKVELTAHKCGRWT